MSMDSTSEALDAHSARLLLLKDIESGHYNNREELNGHIAALGLTQTRDGVDYVGVMANDGKRFRISLDGRLAKNSASTRKSIRSVEIGLEFDASAYFKRLIHGRKFSAYGALAQFQIAELLHADGFVVGAEVKVPGHYRNGRVDLVAARDGIVIGIEIDSWLTPKTKSLEKLSAFEHLTHRVLLLNHERNRFGKQVYIPRAAQKFRRSIDFMANLDVVFCEDSEKGELLDKAWEALKLLPNDIDTLLAAPEKTYVYLLVNPVNKMPFYVGISNDPCQRLCEHKSKFVNPHKREVIKAIEASGLEVGMVVVDFKKSREEALDAESKWISKYRKLGGLITNHGSDDSVSAAKYHLSAIQTRSLSLSVTTSSRTSNHGKSWSVSEKAQIARSYLAGEEVSEIAKIHGRSRGAVLYQLMSMAGSDDALRAKLDTGVDFED